MPAFDSEVSGQIHELFLQLQHSLSEITKKSNVDPSVKIVTRSLLRQVQPATILLNQGVSWNSSRQAVKQILIELRDAEIDYGILAWDPKDEDVPSIPALSQDEKWVDMSDYSNDEDSELLYHKP